MKIPIPSLLGEAPVYVNSKQYRRILIRRLKRSMQNPKSKLMSEELVFKDKLIRGISMYQGIIMQ